MKSFALASFTVVAVLSATQLANALPTYDFDLAAREFDDSLTYEARELYDFDVDAVERRSDFEEVELEARGGAMSKLSGGKKDPERKAKYDTGNPRPETPVGEFRQHTAGRKDDYFGDWQTMTKGVNNPAAGKGKKRSLEARGGAMSKISGGRKDPERKAKYDTGNPRPETPVGEFRQHTAGRKDDYFGDWQTMTKGVNNPAAGKGKKRELEARGGAMSKLTGGKKDPERKAKYDTGNPRPETPVGEFRQHTAGRKDDYFGDWQTMTKGVNNPAAGKGKKRELEARGGAKSKLTGGKKDPERKAKYDTGNPRPETPVGEFRQHTAGRKDDYFGDWQTMTKGVNNPAAGKGKKRELEARGGAMSKLTGGKKDPERKAKYDTGNPRPETPVGEFRQHTAGRKDDYFGDWQTMTGGVNNPAAGKGKKKRSFYYESLEDLE